MANIFQLLDGILKAFLLVLTISVMSAPTSIIATYNLFEANKLSKRENISQNLFCSSDITPLLNP